MMDYILKGNLYDMNIIAYLQQSVHFSQHQYTKAFETTRKKACLYTDVVFVSTGLRGDEIGDR